MSAHSFDDAIATALPKLRGPLADEEEGRWCADFGEKIREIKYDIVVSDLRRVKDVFDTGDLWTAASAI